MSEQSSRKDLVCTCSARYPDRGSEIRTRDSARAAGWRIYKGLSFTGQPLDVVLCPACADVPREPRDRLRQMEGQLSLVDVEPVVKEVKRRGTRGREAS